ncbi:helix-turn-helix transcriptional regulator [Streptomyces sp. YIM 98790]|uniref:helix-turn-helix transcriptional regulator n=1 Tax=Streptomyces sp. YIM 98790 TaxID=2689077 RepID=UPI001407B0B5|nr:helix-turn-helix transcriptional regulator [Streptomyces sp. YIM 98790]
MIHPTDSSAQLAARLDVGLETVNEAERKLSALGLLRRSPGGGWVAISPESAADELLGPAEQDILQRRIALAATRARLHALTGDYLEARSMRSARSNIEIIEGIDHIRAVIDDLARTCSQSLDTMHPGLQSEQAIRAALPLDVEMLARGVAIRTLLQHTAHSHPATTYYAEKITAAGAGVRSTGLLPSRMLIYDRNCAVLPLDPENTRSGVALVRDPAVLGFLMRLFEHYWERALPFAEDQREADPAPTGVEREVLVLMAAGKKNEAIAHHLGMSVRSVSRIVSGLMERLDASSRFQAGVRTVQNGWLS